MAKQTYRKPAEILSDARAAKARVFQTASGLTLELEEIPPLLLLDIHSNEAGKPVPPEKVHPAGIAGVTYFDEDDPDYKAALSAWETNHTAELLRLCIIMGVKTMPDLNDPIVAKLRLITPNASWDLLKQRWVQSHLTEDEFAPFIEQVMSQTVITEEGLQEAEATFRDMGRRETDNGVPLPAPVVG